MGMGSYDESEQQRVQEAQSGDEEKEQVSTDKYRGEVSYETPDSADVLMENFKQNKD
ncbi:MAG: DUF5786 family protein [Halobacteria archaeon]